MLLLKKEEVSVHFMDQIMSDLKHFEREEGGKNQPIIAGGFGQAELELWILYTGSCQENEVLTRSGIFTSLFIWYSIANIAVFIAAGLL